jgi:hypothetical protein
MFIVPMAVTKIYFPDQAAVDKQGQGPVNGGLGNLDPLLAQPEIKFIHIKMLMIFKDLPENHLPLRGSPETPLSDILP